MNECVVDEWVVDECVGWKEGTLNSCGGRGVGIAGGDVV